MYTNIATCIGGKGRSGAQAAVSSESRVESGVQVTLAAHVIPRGSQGLPNYQCHFDCRLDLTKRHLFPVHTLVNILVLRDSNMVCYGAATNKACSYWDSGWLKILSPGLLLRHEIRLYS